MEEIEKKYGGKDPIQVYRKQRGLDPGNSLHEIKGNGFLDSRRLK